MEKVLVIGDGTPFLHVEISRVLEERGFVGVHMTIEELQESQHFQKETYQHTMPIINAMEGIELTVTSLREHKTGRQIRRERRQLERAKNHKAKGKI